MRTSIHIGLWFVVLWLLIPAAGERKPQTQNASAALLGPFASTYASVQWIRFDMALRDGEFERAYARANHALELDPQATSGWYTLGSHLVFDRGSLESEPNPSRRRNWIDAGLEVWMRGEALLASAELAFVRGTTLIYVALIADELEWPTGARGALLESVAAFERAAARGEARADEYAHLARAQLNALAK